MDKYLFFFIVFALAALQCRAQKKLIMVQQLFRHGARYPLYPKPEDNTMYALDEKSVGQLTLEGKASQYLLGKKMYETYWNQLFEGTPYQHEYNQSKFYVKAPDINRTLESAQAHLMGIFQNLPVLNISESQALFSGIPWPEDNEAKAGPIFPNTKPFHPVAIHAEKSGANYIDSGDFLIAYSFDNCPNQFKWEDQNHEDPFVKMIYSNPSFVNTLNQLSKVLNKTLEFYDLYYYYDNYICTLYLGKPTLPIYSDPQYHRDFEFMNVLDLYIDLFYTQMQIRTTTDGFFNHTIENMKRAIKQRDVQWIIYSSQDTPIGSILAGLNMTNVACIYQAYLRGDAVDSDPDNCVIAYPSFSSTLNFEVYEDTENTSIHTFKIRWNGKYRQIPFCGNEVECPVEVFYQWYNDSIKIKSYTANCGWDQIQAQNQKKELDSAVQNADKVINPKPDTSTTPTPTLPTYLPYFRQTNIRSKDYFSEGIYQNQRKEHISQNQCQNEGRRNYYEELRKDKKFNHGYVHGCPYKDRK